MSSAGPQILGNPSLLTSPEPNGKLLQASDKSPTAHQQQKQHSTPGNDEAGCAGAAEAPHSALSSPSSRDYPFVLLLAAFCAWDLLVSAGLACVSFAFAYRDDGVSLYCLSVQALSHLGSSLVLVMRYMSDLLPPRDDNSPVSDDELLRARRKRDLKREQGFAIGMAIAMLLSCGALLFKAFRKIKFWDVWYLDHTDQDMEIEKVTDAIAWCGVAGYLVQALVRLLSARRLRSAIIWHAFAVSSVSLVFFAVLAVAASYEREWSWKAEPIAAMVLVFVMVCESIRMVITYLGDMETQLSYNPHL